MELPPQGWFKHFDGSVCQDGKVGVVFLSDPMLGRS